MKILEFFYSFTTVKSIHLIISTMENKNFLKGSTLSLSDIENTDSEILKRIANDLENQDVLSMAHSSHSSSSGRGHSSYVSGSAAKKDKDK